MKEGPRVLREVRGLPAASMGEQQKWHLCGPAEITPQALSTQSSALTIEDPQGQGSRGWPAADQDTCSQCWLTFSPPTFSPPCIWISGPCSPQTPVGVAPVFIDPHTHPRLKIWEFPPCPDMP